MFGSGFSLGFTMSDVTTQVTAFLSNAVVIGLIATALALLVLPRIIATVKSSLGSAGGRDDIVTGWGRGEYNSESFEGGSDEWQNGTGRVKMGGDTFWYSNDPDDPYVTG